MKYKVHLRLFCDYATGDWGVTHDETCNHDQSFNAFWNGIGIFHDVFEHQHEFTHKYFRGDYAMNIIGEVAATGHIIHFSSMHRPVYGNSGVIQAGINDTLSPIRESSISGYTQYGYELLCKIPRQRNVEGYNISEFVNEYGWHIDELKKDTRLPKSEQEREDAIQFRKSIKFWKIKNAAYWGYKRAMRLFPRTDHNREMIEGFFSYWYRFCKHNAAEDVARLYDKIIFTVTTGKEATWTAHFRSNEDHSLTHYRNVEIW